MGHFDGQVGEAGELILQFGEHLFRFRYLDLVLQRLELGARDANVEARCVYEFEEIGVDPGSMPKMKFFQRSEFICTCKVRKIARLTSAEGACVPFNRKASAWVLFFWICNVR